MSDLPIQIFEVLRNSGHGYHSVGLFDTRDLALKEVDYSCRWIEAYHGPYYPVTWKPQQLWDAEPGVTEWVSEPYGDRVRLTERILHHA